MKGTIRSAYICVRDMDRAIKFYEGFFETEVLIKDELYSVFDIKGFRLGLFNNEKINEEHIYGSNCLLSVNYNSLDELKEKMKDKEVCFNLTVIGNNYVSEIVDSEGNHIELTCVYE